MADADQAVNGRNSSEVDAAVEATDGRGKERPLRKVVSLLAVSVRQRTRRSKWEESS
jgi:hypothetical protein